MIYYAMQSHTHKFIYEISYEFISYWIDGSEINSDLRIIY